MKKPGIYARILLLMTITGVIYLLLLSVLYFFKNKQEKLIFDSSRDNFEQGVNSIVTLNGASLKQVIFDYTFWDEFVAGIETNDSLWYNDYISTVLASFRFDYVCVYDSSFNLDHEMSSEGLELKGIIPQEAVILLKQKRFLDFFIKIPDGLFAVSSGSVHTNEDPNHNLTNPRGYFFLAKKWDSAFLDNLSGLTSAKIDILQKRDSVLSDNPYTVTLYKDLAGWDNIPVTTIAFSREFKALKLYNETALIMQILIIVFFVVAWLIFRISTGAWIIRPLKLVSGILASENTGYIKKLQNAPGEFRRIGVLFEDNINQKKELKIAKEHAEKSDRLKTEFLHNMSHEIRTPVNGIMGFSNLLYKEDLTTEERDEFIKIIHHNSEQLLRIIDDILEISKLETKQVRIQNAETNLNHLLSDLYAVFKIKANEKNISLGLVNDLSEYECVVMIDESKLLKILNNLVENALKFTNNGFVGIGCRHAKGKLIFYVKDTGIGIAKENQGKIFERFLQESETVARNFGGLGLGLSIARENVELLGGEIGVESSPGVGSVFTFSIPYKPVPGTTTIYSKTPTKINGNTSGVILIAEDDTNNLRYFETILSKSYPNLRILSATDGQQAVDKCNTYPEINLVLMDIKMPVMDGYEATRQIKASRPELPVIVQTAYSTLDEKNNAIAAGCDDFITKPVSEETLELLISRYLKETPVVVKKT
jgi:signal transduction histidine kinase/ActR/RegA family two-component response regulator